ncbi:meteorin-like protein [Lingula anatina]|uniref:Meteorin-like protein n=1 Tax=Lingula anatina TaxID=7574 RepID=A0A1S3HMX8_LINAN|nr:meteorin-like protein [Lingula anatina]|eukprot:XP_013387423.1 meteorin-like protein [Lingula anatina]
MKVYWCVVDLAVEAVLLFLLTLTTKSTGQVSHKGLCDHTITSDLSLYQHVTDISVDCAEGHIDWRQPYGALRITMTARRKKSPMRACFLASSIHSRVKFSLEGPKGLQYITILNNTHSDIKKEICFDSYDSVVFFVEVEPNSRTSIAGKLHIEYDIQKLYNKLTVDSMEECRPCTDEELLNAYCSSEYVVIGAMEKVENNQELEETTMHLQLASVVRQKITRFKRQSFHGDIKYTGSVVAPLKCGIRHGEGDFLFTGRMRLGKLRLQCAPLLKDWERLKHQAIKQGIYPCRLD